MFFAYGSLNFFKTSKQKSEEIKILNYLYEDQKFRKNKLAASIENYNSKFSIVTYYPDKIPNFQNVEISQFLIFSESLKSPKVSFQIKL